MKNQGIVRHFYVAGYVGEGSRRMLMDLQEMETVTLIDQTIENKWIRFLYYRLARFTDNFRRFHFLKRLFYPWYTLLRINYSKEVENCILFFNSGFCHELDDAILGRLRNKDEKLKMILYIVDPMSEFEKTENLKIISRMDLVYSINKNDCEEYGYLYYDLIYSRENNQWRQRERNSDLYYLGSGEDRTDFLQKISRECEKKGVKADFHVLSNKQRETEGIIRHKTPVPYEENINWIMETNCILEIMHEDFDNPTQRYSEAVVYNKKLLTNNNRITDFKFYNPQFMQIFQTIDDINIDFIKNEEKVEYGYLNEFSPQFLIQEIDTRLKAKE